MSAFRVRLKSWPALLALACLLIASAPLPAAAGSGLSQHLGRRAWTHLAAGPFGPVTPQITATAPLGTLAGRFEVDDAGAARYTIPLELPPAAAGLLPELTLRYDSSAGDGELGVGWSLGGQSSIARCQPNLAVDGRIAPVSFTSDDALCLDGQRLVLVAGQPWQAGAEYRLRKDDYSRVQLLADSRCVDRWAFEVRHRDGLIDRYGCSDDALVRTHRGVLRWARSTREDRFGNFIRYDYDYQDLDLGDQGWARADHRLVTIAYGGHREGPALEPSRQVSLSWSLRPDIHRGWFAGVPGKSSLRLRELVSSVDGEPVRRWPLVYANDSITGRSRLVEVRECAADGACRPATRFDWLLGEAAAEDMPAEAWSFDNIRFPYMIDPQAAQATALAQAVLDGDGDGRSDLLAAVGQETSPAPPGRGWEFWQSQPGATSVAGNVCSLNNDLLDPEDCPPGLYRLIEGPRSEILSSSNSLAIGIKHPMFALEYDGDGRDDAIVANGTTDMGFAAWSFSVASPDADDFSVDEVVIDIVDEPFSPAWIYATADLTGDGLGDLLYCQGGPGNFSAKSWLGTWRILPNVPGVGLSLANRVDTQLPCAGLDRLLLLDHDGDGVSSALVISTWSKQAQAYLPMSEWGNYRALQLSPDLSGAEWVDTGLPPDVAQRWRWSTSALHNLPGMKLPEHGPTVGIDRVLDVQGDGLPDIIRYQLLSGDAVEDAELTAELLLSNDPPVEELGGLRLWINHGGRFVDGGWLTTAAEVGDGLFREFASSSVIDWNGDGILDLLIPRDDTESWWVWQADGDGGLTPLPLLDSPAWVGWGAHPIRSLAAMDVDGDGLHDPVFWSNALEPGWNIWRHLGTQPDRVVRIVDGLGQVTEIDYAAVTDVDHPDLDDTDLDSCKWPHSCRRSARVVVSQHRLDAGLSPGVFREFDHRYAGGRSEVLERRWLGYHRHQVTEHVWRDGERVAIGRRTATFANLSHDPNLATTPLAGELRELLEQRLDPDSGRLHASHIVVANEVVATSALSYHVRQDHSLARTWETTPCAEGFCELPDLSPQDPLTLQVHFVEAYDEFSQPLHERTVIDDPDDADPITVITREIDNDADTWLLGQVNHEIVSSYVGDLAISRERLLFHDPDTGAVSLEIEQPADAQLFLQSSYERDGFGNLTAITVSDAGANLRGGSIDFDARGVFPIAFSNALGHVTNLAWHEGLGVTQTIRDATGVRTLFDYDGLGRTTGVRVYAGLFARGDDVTIDYLPSPEAALRVRSTARGHGQRTLDHDRLGREVAQSWPGADGSLRQVEQRYDLHGNLIERSLPHFVGELPAGSDRWDHDVLGRVIAHTLTDGNVEQWAFVGHSTIHLDADGKVQRLRHDGAGRVVEAIHAPGSPDEERLCLDYGPFSQLLMVRPDCVDPGVGDLLAPGEAPPTIKRYEYDDLGRLRHSFDPSEGPRHYAYNAFGEMIVASDDNGNFIEYEHDVLGRVIRRSDDDGDNWWLWDQQAPGLLAGAFTPTVAEVYDYDDFARLRQSTQVIDDEAWTLTHDYDGFNRPQTLHYPSHPNLPPVIVHADYGVDGSLVALTREGQAAPLWQVEQEDAAGHITRERFANDLLTHRSYDPLRGHLLRIRTIGVGAPLQDLRYQWTAIGALAEREDGRNGQRESLSYDDLQRLSSLTITGPNQQQAERHFAYDSLGNLVHASEVGDYDYDNDGRLLWAGGVAHQWDTNGNLLQRQSPAGVLGFEYTSFDKPRRIVSDLGDELRFDYDAGQQRVLRSDELSGGERRRFGPVFERERDGEGGERFRYFVHGRGRVVAQIEQSLSFSPDPMVGERTRFLHDDHLGSTDLVSDEQAEPVQRLSYDAWGQGRDPEDWTTPQEFVEPAVTRGYTGHDARSDFGLIDMGGRLYDPQLGRMTSADPVIVDALRTTGWNRYAYVLDDPLSQVDPSGFNPAGLSDWAKQRKQTVGKDGSKITIGAGVNPESGKYELEVVVAGQLPPPGAGTASDAGPAADARGGEADPRWEDAALGVADGLGNTGAGMLGGSAMALFPPATPVVVAGYWLSGGNPFGAARRFVGGLIDSETLAKEPDSMTYEGTRVATEIVAGSAGGLADAALSGARSGLGRVFGSCNCGGAIEGALGAIGEGTAAAGCFPAGTLVRTPEGNAPIEDLRPGDQVLAGEWVEGQLTLVPRTILATSTRDLGALIALGLRSEDGQTITLMATADHPFFVPERQAFLQANALQRGDQLVFDDGRPATVARVSRRPGSVRVYNLDVEDSHSYFATEVAGGPAVLVHNGPCPEKVIQGLRNYLSGKDFEEAVLQALNQNRNRLKVSGTTLRGEVGRSVPDVLGSEIVEIKNRLIVTNIRQLQIQANAAMQRGLPFHLIVSPRTRRISGAVRSAVKESLGDIKVFDPKTGVFSPFVGP